MRSANVNHICLHSLKVLLSRLEILLEMKAKAKLRFSAPSAGIAEIEQT